MHVNSCTLMLQRRHAIGLVAAAMLTASALVPASAQDVVELTVMSHPNFSPSAGNPDVADAYRRAWDEFLAANPDVRLREEPHSGSTEALQDVLTRGNAGRLSDMGVMDTFWVSRLHADGYLQPLDDVLSEEDEADFIPGVLEATTYDGHLRAIYMYNPWRGLFYRPSVVNALGYDAPPTEWNAFLEFGRAALAAGHENAVMLPALGASELTMQYLYTQYLGLGGTIHDDQGRPNFQEPGNRELLEQVYGMWRQLVEDGLMPAQVGSMDEAAIRPFFYSGETVLLGHSTSSIRQMYTDMPPLEGDLNVSAMPMPEGLAPIPLLASWSYVIFTEDPAKTDAASRFIRHMLSPEVLGELNAAQGHLPMRTSIWENNPNFADSELMQRLYTIMNDPRIQERSTFPIYPAIKDAITNQMADVIAGNITPAEAVDRAAEEAMSVYERMGS